MQEGALQGGSFAVLPLQPFQRPLLLTSVYLQGYGKRIMFGIEVWVLDRGLPLKISATVGAAQKD